MKDFLKKVACCFNPYVVGIVLIGILVLYFFKLEIDMSPLLLLALVCPLSMFIMMFIKKK